MIKTVKVLLKRNYSFLILGLASVSFLFLNLFLKDILNDSEYGMFSIIITCISILFSVGLLGFDQVFVRTAVINEKKIMIDSRLINISVCIMIISILLFCFIYYKYYDFGVNNYFLSLSIISIILLRLSYQLLRTLSLFVLSQLTLNFWKIVLPFILLISFLLDMDISLREICFYIFFLIFFSLISYLFIFSKINLVRLEYSTIDLLKLGLGFFVITASVTLLGFLERFIIERKFGIAVFGNYFFYLNIYLYPFLIFSNYIGFKKIVEFKKSFSNVILRNRIKEALNISALLGTLYFLITIIIQYSGLYNFDIFLNLELILMILLWGIVRIIASLISSVY